MATSHFRDGRGLEATAGQAAAVEALEEYQENVLRGNDAAGAVLKAAKKHGNCPLLLAGAATLHLYSQATAEIETKARPLLVRAAKQAGNDRERLFIAALTAWANNDFWRALALLERLTTAWPQDLVAAKVAEMLFFITGQSRSAPLLMMMERLAPEHPKNAPFLAMHSFALELNGQFDRAEASARAALAEEDNLGWAQHTLGHVFLNRGTVKKGLMELQGRSRQWHKNGRGVACHNWWHLALMHLALLDTTTAHALCRDQIWGIAPDNVFELTDTIALLWRLEMAGENCDAEWNTIAPHARPRAKERVFPFLSAHLMYALARAGEREVTEAMLADVAAHASTLPPGPARRTWGEIGRPLLRGVKAFGERDYISAYLELAPIAGRWLCAGGSDAQNDLFDQTYLVAAIRAGELATARRLYSARVASRTPWPLEESWRMQMGA